MSGTESGPRGPVDDLERRLADSLHRSLDPLTAGSDLTAPAIARSRRLRRNRAVLVGTATVLAALVIAAPFALSSLREDGRLIDPGPARPMVTGEASSPRPSTTTRPSTAPSTTPRPPVTAAPTLDADAPPSVTSRPSFTAGTGAPDVSYVRGTTVHDLVRDREVSLQVTRGSQLGGVDGLFADGSPLGTVLSGGEWDVVIWDGETGALQTRLPGGTILALDSERTLAAYSDAAERLHVIRSDGTVVATAPRPGLLAVGIIGDVVYVNDIRSERQQGYTWNLRTEALEPFDGRFGPAHAGSGLVVFLPAPGAGSGTCFRLLDARADLAVRWTACGDFYPTAFSPSGELLVGGLGIDGGSPYDLWVMRSSDGARVLHVDANRTGLMLTGSAVDDRDQALTVVAQNADLEEGLVRCPLDGSACTVVGKPERLDTTTASGISPPAWQVLR